MIYKIEFYQLTPCGNRFYIRAHNVRKKGQVDKSIELGKWFCKEHLRTNDKLLVYIKNKQGEILDKYTFEKQEIKD